MNLCPASCPLSRKAATLAPHDDRARSLVAYHPRPVRPVSSIARAFVGRILNGLRLACLLLARWLSRRGGLLRGGQILTSRLLDHRIGWHMRKCAHLESPRVESPGRYLQQSLCLENRPAYHLPP